MGDRPRVLLADQDVHCRQALEPAMQHITELIAVTTTEEAMKLLQEGPFDVVLADIGVPGQGGLWLLQQVQAASPNTKRVLMSGKRPDNFAELRQSGVATDLVRKPALITHLVSIVVGTTPAPAPPAQS
jgi:DNA-binding NtrC family response regulator